MKKSIILGVLCVFLVGCSEDYSGESNEIQNKSVVDSTQDVLTENIVVEENKDVAAITEEVVSESSTFDSSERTDELIDIEKTEEAASDTEDDDVEYIVHEDADWKFMSVGPILFEGPDAWLHNSSYYDGKMFYPKAPGVKELDYSISVGINEHLTVEDFVDRDLGQYEDVYHADFDLDGHYAVFMGYTHKKLHSDEEEDTIVIYVELDPDGGVGIITYDANAENPEVFKEDFDRLVNSITIGEMEKAEVPTREYVLNKSTKTFHEESCYKVKQIENKGYYTGTRDELISQGYKGCGICNP